jgi:hypothetical protein
VNSPLKTRRERGLVSRLLFTDLLVRILFDFRKTSQGKKIQKKKKIIIIK